MAPTLLYKCIDSLGKGIGRKLGARRIGTKLAQTYLGIRNRWGFYLGHGERQVLSVLLVGIVALIAM